MLTVIGLQISCIEEEIYVICCAKLIVYRHATPDTFIFSAVRLGSTKGGFRMACIVKFAGASTEGLVRGATFGFLI